MRLEESVRLARNKSLLSGWLLFQFLIRFYVVCLNTTAFLVQFLFGSKETLHRTSSARDNASDASTSAVQGLDRVRRRHFCPKTPHQDWGGSLCCGTPCWQGCCYEAEEGKDKFSSFSSKIKFCLFRWECQWWTRSGSWRGSWSRSWIQPWPSHECSLVSFSWISVRKASSILLIELPIVPPAELSFASLLGAVGCICGQV